MEEATFRKLEIFFPAHINKIREYATLDADFQRLCQEFEQKAEVIDYIKILIKTPKEALQQQLTDATQHLLNLQEEKEKFYH